MAVVWSYAFGAESSSVLADMGFVIVVAGGTNAPTSTAADTYTYPAFGGTKYSWSTSAVRRVATPALAVVDGAVTVAIKANTDWYASSNSPLLRLNGSSGQNINFYCTNSGTGTMSLYVDNTLAGTTTLTLNDWHYLAFVYDVSGTTWTCDLHVNGSVAPTISGSDNSGVSASTTVTYETGGFSNTLALCAQIIVHDSSSGLSTVRTPYFATRIELNTPVAGDVTGTWTAGGTGPPANNLAAVSGSFDKATYTQNSAPSSSDSIKFDTVALNTALGLTSGSVLSATNHSWSSGTALQAQAYAGVGGSYTAGDAVTPDASDSTYAFGTKNTLSGTDVVQCKYQIV